MRPLLYLSLLIFLLQHTNGKLSICGSDICDGSTKVFLSGMNQAWWEYGYDFGNGNYDRTGPSLEGFLEDISAAGGNSVRIWIHTDGRDTPNFDNDGFAISPDRDGTFIDDLSRYLDKACEENIYVFLVLWNGALAVLPNVKDMLFDESKLQAYIDNVLIPTVIALKDKPALGGWEIINEPEGIIDLEHNENPCLDTSILEGSGAGWANENIPMENMLKFINWQIDAIKSICENELATIGSWSERTQTDEFGWRNYYTDICLRAPAGARSLGVIDIYQMHTYEWEGSYSTTSPMNVNSSVYNIDGKPTIIGEFSMDGGDGRDIEDLYAYAFQKGYDGAWSWQANGGGHHSDDFATQARGVGSIAGQTNDEGKTTNVHVGDCCSGNK